MRGRLAFALLFALLVLVRVPSLAEPAGADQGLYAYVGQRILEGGLPYRDAWDQKPPAIHATYALMLAAWPDQAVVAATDLLAASVTALLVLALGRRLSSRPGAGETAALLFLLLSNPALGRLGGMRVRSQCEVFIALAVTAALLLEWHAFRGQPGRRGWSQPPPRAKLLAVGALIGIAALYKYNALAYLAPAVAAAALWRRDDAQRLKGTLVSTSWLLAGTIIPVAAAATLFAVGGALDDLYQATFLYNLRYSGETYAGPGDFLHHLVTFPVAHARIDSLWWLGGLGSAVWTLAAVQQSGRLVVPIWVGAACLSIAINGSRGLPQYFVQAAPALAVASGLLLSSTWHRVGHWARVVLIALVATGLWRVSNFPKAVDYTRYDFAGLTGRLERRAYLERFGEPASDDKFSALAVDDLARYLEVHTTSSDRVLVFGFSHGALVLSGRESASRFFWSRPVIVGFNEGTPGYGAGGLLAELERARPEIVVLQRNDWQAEEGTDSAGFFLGEPRLRAWLERGYRQAAEQGNFLIYRRGRT